MRHVFVHVVRAIQDPFAGLRHALQAEGETDLVEVRFDAAEFDHIDRVEYTRRRFLRAFYYPAIFRSLCRRLDAALAGLGDGPANVYFTDEGVWAVVWAEYRRRLGKPQVRGVNVQHGHAEIRPAKWMAARRVVNALSRGVTGFPCLGYGSLGGAGPEPFDVYLTYETVAADHLRQQLGRQALAAPRVIKHELIAGFSDLVQKAEAGPTSVLFAMNINMRGSPIKCDVGQTFDALLEMAQALHEMGVRLIVRLHPGMDRAAATARFAAHPIARCAELDTVVSLQQSMARVQVVMSFLSTVLWEAGLVGLLPVQVVCHCCDDARLTFEREVLELGDGMRPRLAELVAKARAPQAAGWLEREAAEWRLVRPLLEVAS